MSERRFIITLTVSGNFDDEDLIERMRGLLHKDLGRAGISLDNVVPMEEKATQAVNKYTHKRW